MSHVALGVVAWIVAVGWLYKLVETAIGLRHVPNLLQSQYDIMSTQSMAVIVPGRNEARHISACLESLRAQDYGYLRVIAVDDRSTDGTGDVMRRIAESAPENFEVLTIAELPPDWLGKSHAMAIAARHAIASYAPEYLLFTDADVLFQPDALRRSLALVRMTQADHFVLLPTTIAKTKGEAMLLSCLQVLGLWAIRPWRVSDAAAKRDAIGVGAFNLIRTQAYCDLGGFEAMPMEILDDLELGRRVKLAGLRQRVAYGPGLVAVHWAAGAKGIVRGMTKNLFAVFGFRAMLLMLAAVWVAVFCIGPLAMPALPSTRAPAVVTWAAIVGIYFLSGRTSQISGLWALALPVAAGMIVYSMFRSMAITLWNDGVTWRGTFYPMAKLRRSG